MSSLRAVLLMVLNFSVERPTVHTATALGAYICLRFVLMCISDIQNLLISLDSETWGCNTASGEKQNCNCKLTSQIKLLLVKVKEPSTQITTNHLNNLKW